MSEFRFKRFSVINEKSAMKVNTDGVLLGAIMTIRKTDRRLLDVGTGTGTIALMAAQRLSSLLEEVPTSASVLITGIDIDADSAAEAAANFGRSPWSDHLRALHLPLEGLGTGSPDTASGPERLSYDLIFSNPPYFENSFQAPQQRRNNARHTSTLSYREIISFAEEYLSPEGRLAFVLPAGVEADLCRFARMNGLFPFRIVRVRTVSRKVPSRIIAEFSRHRTDLFEETLTIHEKGAYSEEYRALMEEFYLYLPSA